MGHINQEFNLQHDWSQSLLINIPNWGQPYQWRTKVEADFYLFASFHFIPSQTTICSFQQITSEFIYLLPALHTAEPYLHAPFQIIKWYLDNYNHKSSVILPHVIIWDLKVPPNQLSAFHKFSKDFYPIYREIFSPGVGPLSAVNKKWQQISINKTAEYCSLCSLLTRLTPKTKIDD